MPAQIVYEGVNGAFKGTLFQGTRFWIALRVPLRGTFVANVEDNGGTVVNLERNADVLIADHARPKFAPPGSISWKFIEDSVKRGELCDMDKYRIAQADEPRPLGSTKPVKGTKNPFSKRDDEILLKFIRRQERTGASLSGNKIYQELEKEHPNHTWSSWRTRWVQKFALSPRDRLPILNQTPSPSPPRQEQPPKQKPPPRQVPPRTVSTVTTEPDSDDAQEPLPPVKLSRTGFTKEDDWILAEYVKQHPQSGVGGQGGNTIYRKFAEEHPHHTWQSWRDRWVRHGHKFSDLPRPPDDQATKRAARLSSTAALNSDASSEQTPHRVRIRASETRIKPPIVPQDATPQHPGTGSAPAKIASTLSNSDRERLKKLEQRQKEIRSAKTIQRIWRGHRIRRDLSKVGLWKAVARGQLVRKVMESLEIKREPDVTDHFQLEPMEDRPARLSPPKQSRKPTPREQFHIDLGELQTSRDKQHTSWVQAGGRVLELWNLWEAARENHRLPECRDWEAISEELGFDWVEMPDVTNELRAAYDLHLGELEELLADFSDDEEDEEDEEADQVEIKQEGVEEDERGANPRAPSPTPYSEAQEGFASSPPLKEPVDQSTLLSESGRVGPSNKRRRYALEDEGQSTPDQKRLRPTPTDISYVSTTPANRFQPHSSPQRLPKLPASNRIVEPETQDFDFNRGFGGHEVDEDDITPLDDDDITPFDDGDATVSPSQQLRSELGVESPVPPLAQRPPAAPREHAPRVSHGRPYESSSGSDSSSESGFATPIKPLPTVVRNSLAAHRRTLPPTWSPLQPMRSSVTPRRSIRNTHQSIKSSGSPRLVSHHYVPASTPPHTANMQRQRPPATSNHAQESNSRAIPDRFISLGYPPRIVSTALMATSMAEGIAGIVMESLRRGDGIPTDMRGVWTAEDDRGLMLIQSIDFGHKPRRREETELRRRAMAEDRRLRSKHGDEEIERRKSFLVALAMV
ncbi:TRF2-interacting telomeric protein/Rap1 C terminal domain-containing protein [Podospora appendiculata]|uniref:DNA-binding protein RAP1 n=1 Tax=Podospora appendiculata TaxID=314037 RepID=A0AAE1CG13_9PEZI|nr:TRF2-interacting telomeric protein/Rap1 C terminal domain-containing protein [Podospora appendiculata]